MCVFFRFKLNELQRWGAELKQKTYSKVVHKVVVLHERVEEPFGDMFVSGGDHQIE